MRRGSSGTVPPPPGTIYGPVQGTQFIRDHAGPLVVTNPGGGVAFSPASNIGTLITNNPANTIFVASQTGTYTNFRGVSYGVKHPRFFFPGNALTDYNITGAGTLNEIGLNGNAGLEVYGGKWTGYGTLASAFSMPINAVGGNVIIRDAFFTGNGQSGLQCLSTGAGQTFTVQRCKMSLNGRYNITTTTNVSGISQGAMTIESNLFETGNTGNFNPGGDASCMKINNSNGTVMRYNWSKNNNGFGIWFDGANRQATITDNVVENNVGGAANNGAGGLFYELGYGGTVIANNYCVGNGDPNNNNYPFNAVQLIVSCAPCDGTGDIPTGVFDATSEIRYNDVDANAGFRSAIVLYNHSTHPDSQRTRKWYVHHNRIWSRGASGQSRTGLSDQCTPGSAKEGDIGTSPNAPGLNLFDFNEYHVADPNGSYWNHDSATGTPGARTWAQFQARGHETNGTVAAI